MENIIEVIPVWIMLAIGIVLLGIELLIGTFVVLFFGIAFVVIGFVGFFLAWPSGELQILVAMLLSGLLVFLLRPLMVKGLQKEDLPLETMQVGDLGEIVSHGGELRLMYKGTTWAFKTQDQATVSAGEEVMVEKLHNNVAIIKKINE